MTDDDVSNVSVVDQAKALLAATGFLATSYALRTGLATKIGREFSILRSASRSFSMLSRLERTSRYAYGLMNDGREPMADLKDMVVRDIVRPGISMGERYARRILQ